MVWETDRNTPHILQESFKLKTQLATQTLPERKTTGQESDCSEYTAHGLRGTAILISRHVEDSGWVTNMSLPRTESEGLARTGRDGAGTGQDRQGRGRDGAGHCLRDWQGRVSPHLGSSVLSPYYVEESRDWVVAEFSEAISFLLGAGAVAQTWKDGESYLQKLAPLGSHLSLLKGETLSSPR